MFHFFKIDTRLNVTTGAYERFSTESGHILEHVTESNYIFRLSEFKQDLREYLGRQVITPDKYQAVLHDQIDQLQDLSVSREASRVGWGIPVPDDHTQVNYNEL